MKHTLRVIERIERTPERTFLYLPCGHHRAVGGNHINDYWACGPAHMLLGAPYPCSDGACGR